MKPRRSRRGFTLIELLTVIAIIGVLAGILIPTVGSAITSAKRAKGRNQMRQYAIGLQNYKAEYGYYPTFIDNTGKANLGTSAESTAFIKAMSGRQPEGQRLSDSDRLQYNPKAIAFLSFAEQEFYSNPSTGDVDYYRLADPFNNYNIQIRTETSSYRGVVRNLNINASTNKTAQNWTEVRAPVVVYTLYDGSAEAKENGWETLLSWE